MEVFSFIILAVVFLIIISFLIYQITQIFYSISPYHTVFLPTQLSKIVPIFSEIYAKYIPDTTPYTFVELGAGAAGISSFMAKTYPWKGVQAIDSDVQMHVFARFWQMHTQGIQFILGNVFQISWSKPSVVYAYLNSYMMDRLYREGKLDGCFVISASFNIKDREPDEIFPIRSLQKEVYVYDFRETKNAKPMKTKLKKTRKTTPNQKSKQLKKNS